jgi:hypothetical protein
VAVVLSVSNLPVVVSTQEFTSIETSRHIRGTAQDALGRCLSVSARAEPTVVSSLPIESRARFR